MKELIMLRGAIYSLPKEDQEKIEAAKVAMSAAFSQCKEKYGDECTNTGMALFSLELAEEME